MKRLDAVVKELDAKLVLSSSWRSILGLERTTAALVSRGLSAPFLGETPDHVAVGADPKPVALRWPEIRARLDSHPEVTRWAIVDDLPLEGVPSGRLIQTNIAVGITDEDCANLRVLIESQV